MLHPRAEACRIMFNKQCLLLVWTRPARLCNEASHHHMSILC